MWGFWNLGIWGCGDLDVAQVVQCGEKGDAGGVGAEGTLAEAEGLETGREKFFLLLGRPAAVGTDGEEWAGTFNVQQGRINREVKLKVGS